MTSATSSSTATKIVHIEASPAVVWRALTDARCIESWMSPEALAVETSWEVGSPIVFRGVLHGKIRFENTGKIQVFDAERVLRYTHWSSLSRRVLADAPENHVSLTFALFRDRDGTRLELVLDNMHDDAIRGHMDFHWDMTLPALKRFCEVEAQGDIRTYGRSEPPSLKPA
jgi:uncharacterized protein YndB with AHSA1/START domain